MHVGYFVFFFWIKYEGYELFVMGSFGRFFSGSDVFSSLLQYFGRSIERSQGIRVTISCRLWKKEKRLVLQLFRKNTDLSGITTNLL